MTILYVVSTQHALPCATDAAVPVLGLIPLVWAWQSGNPRRGTTCGGLIVKRDRDQRQFNCVEADR